MEMNQSNQRPLNYTAFLGTYVSPEMKSSVEMIARETGLPQAAIIRHLVSLGLEKLNERGGKIEVYVPRVETV